MGESQSLKKDFDLSLEIVINALAGVAQWIDCQTTSKGSLIQVLVRAHAWVAGQVPGGGCARDNHLLMFLSLSVSLPSPLSKNISIKSFKNDF